MENLDVTMFKLVDGSIIFGQISSKDSLDIVVKDPCDLQQVLDPQTRQPTLGLVPKIKYLEDSSISINRSNILYRGKANIQFIQYYTETLISHKQAGLNIASDVEPNKIITPEKQDKKLILLK